MKGFLFKKAIRKKQLTKLCIVQSKNSQIATKPRKGRYQKM